MVCQYFGLVLFYSAWVSENTVLNIKVCFQACKLSWTNEEDKQFGFPKSKSERYKHLMKNQAYVLIYFKM